MAKITVLIAEHSEIAQEGIVSILNSSKRIRVAGVASTAKEACRLHGELKPTLIMLSASLDDLSLHDVMSRINRGKRKTPLILLSHSADLFHIHMALQEGIAGYLLWTIPKQNLLDAVLKAANGERVFSNEVEKRISDHFARQVQPGGGADPAGRITLREREVLKLVTEGFTSAEIAGMLYISLRTVETHRANLLSKLKIKNTAGLIRYALSERSV